MILDLKEVSNTLDFITYNIQHDFVHSFIEFLSKINQTAIILGDRQLSDDIFVLAGYIIYHLFIINNIDKYTILIGDEINSYYCHNFYMFNIKNQFEVDVIKRIVLDYCKEREFNVKIEQNTILVGEGDN